MGLYKFNKNKELKKLDFNKNKSKYIKICSLISLLLILVISVIYFTYSKFTASDSFIILDTTVGTFTSSDYIFAFYVDGEETSEMPTSDNYYVNINCNKGATGIWLDDTKQVLLSNVTQTGTRCSVRFTTKYEDNTGASAPELYAGLIPITYDDSNNILVADVSSEWYNYNNHEWANAILIDQNNSSIKAKYINENGSFKSGATVDIADVLQMYVWVPRYKYKLFNAKGNTGTTAQMIEVEFESKDTVKSTSSTNGEWLTHPAFTFGDTELEGIWVGKFESSGSTSEITIIPNVSSLRSINVSTMFNASRAIETTAKYGLSSSEVDTHMMKNMEWGAVAYLTNSKYGRYIDASTCIDSECEVWINNNDSYTTGCAGDSASASPASKCNAWNTSTGVNASTTGTIYGIYDMSGGTWEYVMGNMVDSSGSFYPSSSGFESVPDSKYYDSYAYGTTYTDYTRGYLGDATKEVSKWNNDSAFFVYSDDLWFGRGANYRSGSSAGVFYFSYFDGNAYSSGSFRVVLGSE